MKANYGRIMRSGDIIRIELFDDMPMEYFDSKVLSDIYLYIGESFIEITGDKLNVVEPEHFKKWMVPLVHGEFKPQVEKYNFLGFIPQYYLTHGRVSWGYKEPYKLSTNIKYVIEDHSTSNIDNYFK